jgi:hypothetical protein
VSSSSSSSSVSCEPKDELIQKLVSEGDNVNFYIIWRDCTSKVETFYTTGSSSRDLKFTFDKSGVKKNIVLTDTDSYQASGDTLFVIVSGGVPIPDNFEYQIRYIE